jgi:hypothetical protein
LAIILTEENDGGDLGRIVAPFKGCTGERSAGIFGNFSFGIADCSSAVDLDILSPNGMVGGDLGLVVAPFKGCTGDRSVGIFGTFSFRNPYGIEDSSLRDCFFPANVDDTTVALSFNIGYPFNGVDCFISD